MKENNKVNSKIFVANIAALFALVAVFFLLSGSAKECLGFAIYFMVLFAGGKGILSALKALTGNTLIDGVNSVMAGATSNFIAFTLLRFTGLDANWSLFLVLGTGTILMAACKRNANEAFAQFSLRDPMIAATCILAVFSVILISDNIYYLKEGLMVHDQLHPTYELSISAGLDSMFPVWDKSYDGKTLKYHFGSPIIFYQLINIFGLEPLKLAYILFPSFLITLFLLFTNELSRPLEKRARRLIFIAAVFFSTLSVNTDLLMWVKSTTGLSIPYILGPPQIFSRIAGMGSYGLGILLLLSLYSLIRLKKRSYGAECLILLGICFSKSTFFVPIAAAYVLYSVLAYALSKDVRVSLKSLGIVLPGALCLILFVLDAHKYNLWAVFPGSLNIDGVYLKDKILLLYANVVVSAVSAPIIYIGIGLLYLIPQIRKALKDVVSKKSEIISSAYFFYLIVIISSYAMGLLLCEVTEGNQLQFLFPGYVFLALLSYEFVLKGYANNRFFMAFFTALVLFNSVTYIALQNVLPSLNYAQIGAGQSGNAIADAKLGLISIIPSGSAAEIVRTSAQVPCFYSYDLLGGLGKISGYPEKGIFVFNMMEDFCENRQPKWVDNGFIMTAVSRRQTVVENYKYKGVLAEPGYCNRTFDNIVFYEVITGKEEGITKLSSRFNDTNIPKFEDMSYYRYLQLFSKKNFYTYNQDFIQCIEGKISNYTPKAEDKISVLKDYLRKNNVRFILFQNGTVPLEEYVSALNLQSIYKSRKVNVYKAHEKIE